MDAIDDGDVGHMFKSRIFSTEVGMRPAEPCSVSLAATHQLLTNLFEYICVIVLSDTRYRRATGALISEQDLLILEKCNQSNIDALADIVGMSPGGVSMESIKDRAEVNLRVAGNLWAEHVSFASTLYLTGQVSHFLQKAILTASIIHLFIRHRFLRTPELTLCHSSISSSLLRADIHCCTALPRLLASRAVIVSCI
jgi:hypothetical protein